MFLGLRDQLSEDYPRDGPQPAPTLLTGPDPGESRPLDAEPIVTQKGDGGHGRRSQWNFEASSGAEMTNQSGDPPHSFLATPPRSRLHLPFSYPFPKLCCGKDWGKPVENSLRMS